MLAVGSKDGADKAPGGGLPPFSARRSDRCELTPGSQTESSTLDTVARYLDDRAAIPGRGASSYKLGRVRKLLRSLGDPQDALRAIHIAGTAGKGSVAAFIAEILTAHGFTVGAYLSPHAYSVLERFQLNGQPVAAEVAARPLADVAPAVAEMDQSGGDRPTFFEVTTSLAFQLFATQGVDYAVVETGLGGLLDATNIISRPDKIAVITTIVLDHTEVLGRALEEIAAQRAGILPRDGGALAVHDQSTKVIDV